jgi:hypothetical protein
MSFHHNKYKYSFRYKHNKWLLFTYCKDIRFRHCVLMNEHVLKWDLYLTFYLPHTVDCVLTRFQCLIFEAISKHNYSVLGFARDNVGLKNYNRILSPSNLAVGLYKYSYSYRQGVMCNVWGCNVFCGFLCNARFQIEVGEIGLALRRIAVDNLNKPTADSRH